MSCFRLPKLICAALAAGVVCQAQPLFACAMCYGATTDSPLAAGMNWGIMSLLVTVVMVLGGVVSFFIFLAKKAAASRAARPRSEMPGSTQKV